MRTRMPTDAGSASTWNEPYWRMQKGCAVLLVMACSQNTCSGHCTTALLRIRFSAYVRWLACEIRQLMCKVARVVVRHLDDFSDAKQVASRADVVLALAREPQIGTSSVTMDTRLKAPPPSTGPSVSVMVSRPCPLVCVPEPAVCNCTHEPALRHCDT